MSAPARLPLSAAQSGVWPGRERPGALGWPDHLVFGVRLRGALDADALRRALDALAARHEAWRTTFPTEDGEPHRVVGPPRPLPLARLDLGGGPAPRDAELRRLLAAQARRPFDLGSEPPVRACLVRCGEDDHALLLVAHHLVADQRTWLAVARELSALYAAELGEPAGLPEPGEDVAPAGADGVEPERDLAYWTGALHGAPPVLDLPADRVRPAQPGMRSGLVEFEVEPAVHARLTELAASHGTSLEAVVLAAVGALLARCCGSDDVLVGCPLPPSGGPGSAVGLTSQVLPVRLDCSGDPNFADLVARAAAAVWEGQAHRDVPVDRLLDALGSPAGGSVHPLYQVGLCVDASPWDAVVLDGVEVAPLPVEDAPLRLDLDLVLHEGRAGLRGHLRYGTDVFEAATGERLVSSLTALLAGVAADPARPISRLPLLQPEDWTRQVVEWNRTEAPFPDGVCAHELFERRAAESPDAVAVVDAGGWLTYGELDRRANRLARHLQRLGAGPERVVAVLLRRSLEVPVAFLAVLKAGAAYLPLDPAYPAARIGEIVEDAGVAVTVTEERLLPLLPSSAGSTVVLESAAAELAEEVDARPASGADPDNLAYVIYTSGSTGAPKGVELAHRGLCNLAAALKDTFHLVRSDRVVLFASLGFDASIWELAMALFNGSSLYALDTADKGPDELAEEMEQAGVTAGTFPPSFLRLVRGQALASLHLVVSAGEACSSELVRVWSGGRRFVNAYGPTETTVCATWAHFDGPVAYAPPIGRPIPNVRAYVLDGRLEPVPGGVTGELCVGGTGLARGYRNRPELTAEAFVPDPFGPPGSRLYRTGDAVTQGDDGSLRHTGRLDHQVKLRGFRIELGEVESAVTRHPGVREAVAEVVEDPNGEARLVAYLVLEPQARAIASRSAPGAGGSGLQADLHRFLSGTLPDHMVPGVYVELDALPLTSSGKVDRAALPEPDPAGAAGADGVEAPRTPTEEVVAAVWARTLELERVGRDDNFLEVGGHSLVAAQVMADLRAQFQVRLPVRLLFERPVLSEFASAVDETLAREGAGQPGAGQPS